MPRTPSPDRRPLRLASLDELAAEVERVVRAESAGTLRRSGHWTVGQTLGHLASWIEYGYDGYPFKSPPWFIRPFIKLQVRRFLRHGMKAGLRIPGVPSGTYGVDAVPTEDARRRLLAGIQRLKRGEVAKFDSPGFGPMSHADRVTLTLRHAELHLSFLHPE
jgi:Protein of unknown function (DUF1569)